MCHVSCVMCHVSIRRPAEAFPLRLVESWPNKPLAFWAEVIGPYLTIFYKICGVYEGQPFDLRFLLVDQEIVEFLSTLDRSRELTLSNWII